MNLELINGYFVLWQRHGNDKNGNPIYLVNIFKQVTNKDQVYYVSRNTCIKSATLDKYDSIKVKSYSIHDTIKYLISQIPD